MTAMASLILRTTRLRWRFFLLAALGMAAAQYLIQLVALMVRFQALLNYAVLYDWPGAIATIWRSTPSLSDIVSIAAEEWLFEVGYMNYDFGRGISEWSLVLKPQQSFTMLVVGYLTALGASLLRGAGCSLPQRSFAAATTGIGSFLLAAANITMTWVVCCSSPTWIVGLAMLGLSVSTSFMLEPLGVWLQAGGLLLLVSAVLVAAHSGAARPASDSAGRAFSAMEGTCSPMSSV